MAQVKAHEVDAYLKKPNGAHRVFLIYGPDIGLVSENARLLAKTSGVDLADPFSTIKMDANEAASDKSAIADEAHTVSMFGGQRLVWIKGSTQKNLANAIQPVLDLPPKDAWVIIEAGDLKKTAPLRSRIEKSAAAVALPCYQDQARALDKIIDEEIQTHKIQIDQQSRQFLKELLGSDRLASRGEVVKLCLYVGQGGTINIEDIQSIVGDASALAIDTVVDAACLGDIATMEHTFKRLVARGTAVFQIIGAVQRQFQMLHQARRKMEFSKQPASAIIGGFRPPINFQRKDKVTRALSIWPPLSLERSLQRLEVLSLESRKNAVLATSLTATALLAIALEAKRLNR